MIEQSKIFETPKSFNGKMIHEQGIKNIFVKMWARCSRILQFRKQLKYTCITCILHEIYVENELPKLCSKLIFKRLLLKLTPENTFMINSAFYKQVNACVIGGIFSVIFSDVCLT